MKMWITAYALTKGIYQAEGKTWNTASDSYFAPNGSHASYKVGRDAFEEKSEAVSSAREKRVKKIASLKKQIAVLEKLSF